MGDEVWHFIKAVQHHDHRHAIDDGGEVCLQHGKGLSVQAVEWLVENKHIWFVSQRADQHNLAGFTGGKFAKRAIEQSAQTEFLDQRLGEFRVLAVVENHFMDGRAE